MVALEVVHLWKCLVELPDLLHGLLKLLHWTWHCGVALMVVDAIPIYEVADVNYSVALVFLLNLLEKTDVVGVHSWTMRICYY